MAKKEKVVMIQEVSQIENTVEALDVLEASVEIEPSVTYTVSLGCFTELMAKLVLADMKHKGFSGDTIKTEEGFEVNAGVYSQKQNAFNMKYRLEEYGYRPSIQ